MIKHSPPAMAALALLALTGCIVDPTSPGLIDSTSSSAAPAGGIQAQPLNPERILSSTIWTRATSEW